MSTFAPPSSKVPKTRLLVLVLLLTVGGADWLALNLLVAPKLFATTDSRVASVSSARPTAPILAPPPSLSPPANPGPVAQAEKIPTPAARPAQTIAPAVEPPITAETPKPSPIAKSTSLPSNTPMIHFDAMSAFLTADARNTLCSIARQMKIDTNSRIKIVGHTDTRGESELNIRLSQRRAEAASSFLGILGIDSSRIESTAVGAQSPLDTTQSWDSNRKNRRVELIWQ